VTPPQPACKITFEAALYLKWSLPADKHSGHLADERLRRTDWERISRAASAARDGQPWTILDHQAGGSSSLAPVLQFGDGTHCVARLQLRKPTPESSRKLHIEVDAFAFLATATRAPVPRVFAYADCG